MFDTVQTPSIVVVSYLTTILYISTPSASEYSTQHIWNYLQLLCGILRLTVRELSHFTTNNNVNIIYYNKSFWILVDPLKKKKVVVVVVVVEVVVVIVGMWGIKFDGRVVVGLSLIHISEPTRLLSISYAVVCFSFV